MLAMGQGQAQASGGSLSGTLVYDGMTPASTLVVVVKTAEGLPAAGVMLTIPAASVTVPPGGVVSAKVRNGPVTVTATGTPPDSATQVSATARATINAHTTTAVTLRLPASSPLALPAGIAASNSERDLGYLNAERTRWGLPAGLTLNPAWSQACAAHDAYLADNNRFEHPEDTRLPGASPAGAWAGLHSILSGGTDWTAEGNPWEDAPIHLNQLYTPDLTIVGIDESRDTCTTTWPGIGAPSQPGGTIITYPGDGTSGFPPSERASELPFVPGKFVEIPEGAIAGRELFVYEEHGPCSLLACLGPTAPDVESATLTGPTGNVEVRSVGGTTPEIGAYLTGAIVIPVKPLAPNASYTASVTLAPYGELPAESHRWSFQTGPANPDGAWPDGSPSSARTSRRAITGLRVIANAFAVETLSRRRARLGAEITYEDSASGTVAFTVSRLTLGRRSAERCVKIAHTQQHHLCWLATRVYSFGHNDRVGQNLLRLTGRYGRHALAAGDYRLVAIASPGATAATTFEVR